MKLLTYKFENQESIGVLSADGTQIYPLREMGYPYLTMNEFIQSVTDEDMKELAEGMEKAMVLHLEGIPYNSVEKCAPIPVPVQDILCLGINYAAHAEESARYKKEVYDAQRKYPVYFAKRVNRALGDGEEILAHGEITQCLDYEAELAVILSKDAKDVKKEEAADYIFGYTILNDVSARDLQTRHKQWYFGKSLDGTCPMGPWIVTREELGDELGLAILSRVNGEIRQKSNTDLMIFGIDYVLEELTRGTTLKAGTIISMGTPAGVGMGFDPPKFLKEGDVVECEIEGIGILRNQVK